MLRTMTRLLSIILLILLVNPLYVWGLDKPETELTLITPLDKLGENLDLSHSFQNPAGETVKLSSFFKENRPVILVPGYFTCPHLCGLVFNGIVELVNRLDFKLGIDYQIVTVSFDHTDTPANALAKKEEFVKLLKNQDVPKDSWEFLVGKEEQIAPLMAQLGFRYLNDGKDFAHSAAVYVVTPEGAISQYFANIKFKPFDLKLSLVEASKGHVGSLIDQALLFCFRFDHTKGQYTWLVDRSLKFGGILVILLLGGLLLKLWVLDQRK